jgi:hypothetical protein
MSGVYRYLVSHQYGPDGETHGTGDTGEKLKRAPRAKLEYYQFTRAAPPFSNETECVEAKEEDLVIS